MNLPKMGQYEGFRQFQEIFPLDSYEAWLISLLQLFFRWVKDKPQRPKFSGHFETQAGKNSVLFYYFVKSFHAIITGLALRDHWGFF